jgi:hypothetical protein
MFGYRVLGFGSHPSRGAVDSITWSASVDATNVETKAGCFNMGYDTDDPGSGGTHGSIDDATVDGMVSVGGGTVTIIRIIWQQDTLRTNSVRIKLIPTGGSAGTQETGWESVTINGTTYTRATSNFNQSGTGSYTNEYEHVWNTDSNPFGTTSNTTVDVSMSNLV